MTHRLIVIGANGAIGSAISSHFKDLGWHTVGLSHRPQGAQIAFDQMRDNPETIPIETGNEVVVLCGGFNDIDRCLREAVTSTEMNIGGTVRILTFLSRHPDFVPVYLSSDAVFDGVAGNYSETSDRAPASLYGAQKSICEDVVRDLFGRHLIFRMSKVFSAARDNVLMRQMAMVAAGEPISCFHDQYLSPVDVVDIARALEIAHRKDCTGTYHLACDDVASRADIGRAICAALEMPSDLVRSCSMGDMEFLEPRSWNSTLNNAKARDELGMRFVGLEPMIAKYCEPKNES